MSDKLIINPNNIKLEGERFAVECYSDKTQVITSFTGEKKGELKIEKITRVLAVGNGDKISSTLKKGDLVLIDHPHNPIPLIIEETDKQVKGMVIVDYFLLVAKIIEEDKTIIDE